MMKKGLILSTIFTHLVLPFSLANAEPELTLNEEKPSIQVPAQSELHIDTKICDSNISKFVGLVELDGRLDVYWYEHTIDAASPTDLLTETRLALDFYPSIASQDKLPVVLFNDEQFNPDLKIQISNLNHRQLESLLIMFGFEDTKRMLEHKVNQSFTGQLTLSTYSTYRECNMRHYDGEPLAFKIMGTAVKMTSTPIKRGCGE